MGAPHPLLLPLLTGGVLPTSAQMTPEVVASAEEHLVAALVDEALAHRDLEVQPGLRRRLAASVIAVEAESRATEEATSELVGLSDDLGIDLAIFKGAAIAQRFYEEPRRRPAIDIDAFVRPGDMPRLGELARVLGATRADAEVIESMVRSRRVFEIQLLISSTPLDLHRDPMNLMLVALDEDERWERTITLTMPDETQVRTLDLEDTLTQSLLNSLRDNFADLLHLNDVRLMMDAKPDWDEVERRAGVNGWTGLIRHATWFVSRRLGAPSPLPTTLPRWQKRAIDAVWPERLLLRGSDSHARSLRRQSLAGLLVEGRAVETVRAYGQRLIPPRIVIDQRRGTSEGSYPEALVKWRLAQRGEIRALRDRNYGEGG